MRYIEASDAQATFLRLLIDVERGETIVITRHGEPVARPDPERDRRPQETGAAIAAIEALRKFAGKAALSDLLAARHEGHKS